jgi:hypothetical protein
MFTVFFTPLAILLLYVFPALLLTAWTARLMNDWKRHSRGDLPLLTRYHFAPGFMYCRPWPSLGDAMGRYVIGFIPLINVGICIAAMLLFLCCLPGEIYPGSRLQSFFRRPY